LRAFPIAVAVAIYAPVAVAAVEDDLRDGDKYFENGDWKRAAAAYDRAIAKAPGQVAAEAYGKRAAIYIILKDFKGGLAFIERAKSRYPSAPEVLEQEALILWESDRKDDAIKVADQVVKARPQSFTNQKLIGEYYSARDPLKTASAFEAYLQYRPGELESGDVLPRIRLGFAYLANARSVLGDGDDARAKSYYDKARDQFETVQRKHGKKPNAMVNSENGLCAAYVGLSRWDQAISICERVIQDPRRIDSTGSVWFNLSTAYLARKQTKKARSAGTEFTRVRKNEARGFMLLGDTYFEENDWSAALDQYLRAEKALKPNQSREQGMLAIRLGKTYRRLPSPAGGVNTNLNIAIEKLSVAATANPNNVELAIELGGAYLVAKQDTKAMTLADRWIAGSEFGKVPPDQRAAVLVISGKSLFNQKKLTESRQRFEAARQLRGGDVQISRALVTVINEQAFAEVVRKDFKQAEQLLNQAKVIDKESWQTLTNLAVLSLERGDCSDAKNQLIALDKVAGRDAVLTQRLLGRSWLCSNPANRTKAAEAYGNAEREAKKSNAQALPEIYTEWAPLIWDTNIADAVEKLEAAVAAASQDPEVAPAAKRNLALALYRRGWKSMRDGKTADAAADFDRATRDPSVLKGTEPLAFEFSLALALLDSRPSDSARIFKTLAGKGNQGAYLKGAYAQIGTSFFTAYANYKSTNGAQRAQACTDLSKSANQLGGRAKELVAACYESVAYDHYKAGNWGAAQKAIADADKNASAEQTRRLRNNKIAMSLSKSSANDLEALGGNPAEALINLGIVYDQMGKPKEAFDAWNRAIKSRLQPREQGIVQKWIDAKRRIYGY
jgi:lipopolysaccharide biosynthesis regulator YciM